VHRIDDGIQSYQLFRPLGVTRRQCVDCLHHQLFNAPPHAEDFRLDGGQIGVERGHGVMGRAITSIIDSQPLRAEMVSWVNSRREEFWGYHAAVLPSGRLFCQILVPDHATGLQQTHSSQPAPARECTLPRIIM
jgi:hypothetical protein